MVRRATRATRKTKEIRVTPDWNGGYRVSHHALPGDHYYIRGNYADLAGHDFINFLGIFERLQQLIQSVSPQVRPILSNLTATTEHGPFQEVAKVKLPSERLSYMFPQEHAKSGEWGIFDYDAVKEFAKREGLELGEYLARTIPRFDNVGGHDVLISPGRANRPIREGLEKEVFRSIFIGSGGNRDAVKDLVYWAKKGEPALTKKLIDEVAENPERLANYGIGPLVDGHALLMSLDSRTNNLINPSILDDPLSTVTIARDLSPLAFSGTEAITFVNRYGPLVKSMDKKLWPELENAGYRRFENASNGHPIVAEGIALVTISTGFEKNILDRTQDRLYSMLKSLQIGLRRITELRGYENVAVIIGQNVGNPSTLSPWHLQAYVLKNGALKPENERIQSDKNILLYEDGGVKIVADPVQYGRVEVQLKTDGHHYKRSFVDRQDSEIRDLARGVYYNMLTLNLMGFRDWSEQTEGSDLAARIIHPEHKPLMIGMGDHALGRRIITSPEQAIALPIAPGDQAQFISQYKGTLNALLYGQIPLPSKPK